MSDPIGSKLDRVSLIKELTELFLEKGILKICSKFTGEHPCRSVISIKLLSNFIEITLRHAKQLHGSHTSAWVFSCRFAAYFQNTFFKEHLWVAASELNC